MRYILISLGVVLLIIFGIVIFSNSGTKTVTAPGNKTVKLLDYTNNTNASVQYIVEGPINALENHRTIQINIGPNSRSVTVFTGYQGQALGGQTYPNDINAYQTFLTALNRANFTRERKLAKGLSADAVCPNGSRSHYVVAENSKDLMNLWSASCTRGTFDGNQPLTVGLFQAQIPNYNSVVSQANAGTTGNVSF